MRRKVLKSTILTSCLFIGLLSPVSATENVTINSSETVNGTVTLKYTDGREEISQPLWSGLVPTSITGVFQKYSSCQYLTFAIQGLLPFAELKSNVQVSFAVWSSQGRKLASDQVWYSDWNPLDGPTMIDWIDCDDWSVAGVHTLIVTTKQTLSTNGLISRYVEGTQQFPFTIYPTVAPTTTLAPTTTMVTWKVSSLWAGQSKSLSAVATSNSPGVQTWSKTGSCTLTPKSKPTKLTMGRGTCVLKLKIAKSGKYPEKTSSKTITLK